METRRLLRRTAFAAAIAATVAIGRAEAQNYAGPSSGQILADAQIYTEANIGGGFKSFVARYQSSAGLEARIWELTSNSDTLARLAALFGWTDPWRYRQAVRADLGGDR